MIYFRYIDGSTERLGYFYDNWSEVPFSKFIAWHKIVKKLQAAKEKLQSFLDKLEDMRLKYEQATKDNDSDKAAAYLRTCIDIRSDMNAVKETDYHLLELQAISCFTNVPVAALVQMDRKDETSILNFDYEKPIGIEFLKQCLFHLSSKPLPTTVISSLKWQTKTDSEIMEIEERFNKLSWFSRLFLPSGRRLKKELELAVKGEYKVEDIWNQSTYANSQFQKIAKVIIDEMKAGEWDNVPTLISMLLVEKNAHSEALNAISSEANTKEYLEKYAQVFKDVFDKTKALMFEQKNKLSIAHVVGIRNFFLNSQEK